MYKSELVKKNLVKLAVLVIGCVFLFSPPALGIVLPNTDFEQEFFQTQWSGDAGLNFYPTDSDINFQSEQDGIQPATQENQYPDVSPITEEEREELQNLVTQLYYYPDKNYQDLTQQVKDEVDSLVDSWISLGEGVPLVRKVIGTEPPHGVKFNWERNGFNLRYNLTGGAAVNDITFPITGEGLERYDSLSFYIRSSFKEDILFGRTLEASSNFRIKFGYTDESGNFVPLANKMFSELTDIELSGEYKKVTIDFNKFGKNIDWSKVNAMQIYFSQEDIPDKQSATLWFKDIVFGPKDKSELLKFEDIKKALQIGKWDLGNRQELLILYETIPIFHKARELYQKGYKPDIITISKKILKDDYTRVYIGRRYIIGYEKNGKINLIAGDYLKNDFEKKGDIYTTPYINLEDLAKDLFGTYRIISYEDFLKIIEGKGHIRDYERDFENYAEENDIKTYLSRYDKERWGRLIETLPKKMTEGLRKIGIVEYMSPEQRELEGTFPYAYQTFPQPTIWIQEFKDYTIAHEYAHHLDNVVWDWQGYYDGKNEGWLDLSNVFYLISWENLRVIKGEEDDFANYTHSKNEGRGEDLTTMFKAHFLHPQVDFKRYQEKIKKQIEEGRFEFAVKELIATYLIGYQDGYGLVYGYEGRNSVITFKEIEQKMQQAEQRGINIPENTKEAFKAARVIFNNFRRQEGFKDIPELKLDLEEIKVEFPNLFKEVITYGIDIKDLISENSDFNLKIQGLVQAEEFIDKFPNYYEKLIDILKDNSIDSVFRLRIASLLRKGLNQNQEIKDAFREILQREEDILLKNYLLFSLNQELIELERNQAGGLLESNFDATIEEFLDFIADKNIAELEEYFIKNYNIVGLEAPEQIAEEVTEEFIDRLIHKKGIEEMMKSGLKEFDKKISKLSERKARLIHKAIYNKLTGNEPSWLKNVSKLEIVDEYTIDQEIQTLKEAGLWQTLDDFDDGTKPNEFMGEYGSFYDNTNPDLWCLDWFEPEIKLGQAGFSTRIKYDLGKEEGNEVGLYMKLGKKGNEGEFGTADLSKYSSLVFFVKGDEIDEFTTRFKVRIRDEDGKIGIYQVDGIDYNWRKVIIPLDELNIDLNNVDELSFVFDDVTKKEGTIYIDEIGFLK